MVFVTQQQITNADGVKIFEGGDTLGMPSLCRQGVGASRRSCDGPRVKQLAGAAHSRLLWELGPRSHSAAAVSSRGLEQTLLLPVPLIFPVTCRAGSDVR